MKLTKFLSVAAIALLSLSLFSCNKESEPVVLEGSWQLDSAATFLQIVYNPTYAEMCPSAFKYLNSHKEEILKEIRKPGIIQFSAPNVVNFVYKDPVASTVPGTYTQYDIYVIIKNSIFPNSIAAASNNKKLEVYYTKDYMLSILYSMLKPTDDAPETFANLIVSFDGVGVYTRTQ